MRAQLEDSDRSTMSQEIPHRYRIRRASKVRYLLKAPTSIRVRRGMQERISHSPPNDICRYQAQTDISMSIHPLHYSNPCSITVSLLHPSVNPHPIPSTRTRWPAAPKRTALITPINHQTETTSHKIEGCGYLLVRAGARLGKLISTSRMHRIELAFARTESGFLA